jgi:hypothetical protein
MSDEVWDGGCLCGKVRFRVTGKLADVLACHCRQCRRMSGHYYAATAAPNDALQITESAGLAWYRSSEASRRGFCRDCGSSLFFDHGPDEPIGIAAGAFDADPPFRLAAHIYTDEAGGYYRIGDDAAKYTQAEWSRGGWQKYRR